MDDNDLSSADPLGRIADEFVEAFRQGKRPAVEEFARRYPEHADEIRDMLPALLLMERAKLDDAPGQRPQARAAAAAASLSQLGDYQILREVGRGGMGVVYEAQQLSLGRHVAIKVLPAHALLDPRHLARFQREARSAAKLHHTNIVPVFGVGEQDGLHYYVMQFIQGLGLDVVLDELRRLRRPHGKPIPTQGDAPVHTTNVTRDLSAVAVARGLLSGDFTASGGRQPPVGPQEQGADAPRSPDTSATIHLPGQTETSTLSESGSQYWQSVARIGMQVAEALAHASSQGVLHRDIKPANLLLDDTGNVWVTDFGLAKAVSDSDDLTHTGDVVGTLRYMAPERFSGLGDLRSDVYSLGLTLYELLALRPAFDEADRNKLVRQVLHDEPVRPRKLNPAVPRDLETVVLKAIARDPAHRYQTPAEMAEDLKRFVEDRPVKARRISDAERLWRWCRRNPALAGMAATLLLLMVGVTVASVAAAARFDRLAREQAAAAANERQARGVADEARDDADAARRKVETTLTDMHTARGLIAAERGDAAQAMLWFANAARLARNDPERAWANRVRVRTWGREVVLPVGALMHDGQPLHVLAFRPGGDLLLTLTGGGRCFVWDWRRQEPLDWARGGGKTTAACWSPDGAWLAVGRPSGQVEIRRVPAGELRHRLNYPGAVTALAFSPDGQHLAVAGSVVGIRNVVRIWDCRRHAFGPGAWQHPRPVYALVFSPGGDRLATAGLDQRVRVFAVSSEAATAAPLFAPLRHAPEGEYVSPPAPVYIDHGRQLVTITGRQELTCWDADTGTPTGLGRLRTHPFALGMLAAGPGGQSFAAGGYYGPQVWNLANRSAAGPLLAHRNFVQACAYSPDGTLLLTASNDGTAKLWSLPEGKLLGYPLPHQDQVTNAAFAPDGRFLATAQGNGLVRLWRRPKGNPGNHPLPYDHGAMVARLSADGRRLIASGFRIFAGGKNGWATNTRRARVYEVDTGRAAGPDFTLEGELREAALSPDGRLAAAASAGARAASLQVWDVGSGRAMFAPVPLPDVPDSIAFCPDGSSVGVLCDGGQVIVADLRGDTKPRVVLQQPWTKSRFPFGNQLRFTRDGSGLVASSATEVHIRDARTGELRYPPLRAVPAGQGPGVVCTDFDLSADGRLLATAVWGGSNAAQVWDLATGKPLSRPLPHPNRLYQVRFSPDGGRIFTACCDGQARLWDWAAGTLACPPLKHDDEVRSVAFSADGRWGLTACRDNSVGVWELATGKPLLPRLDLKVWDGGKCVDLATGGKRAVASLGYDGFLSIDLADLSAPEGLDADDLCALAELASGQRMQEGDLAGLTSEEWLARWQAFQQRHPRYGTTSLGRDVPADPAK